MMRELSAENMKALRQRVAEMLVPYCYGAFEDQRMIAGERVSPANTPNAHAMDAARRAVQMCKAVTSWETEVYHLPAEGEVVVGAWPRPDGDTHVEKIKRQAEEWVDMAGMKRSAPRWWTHLPRERR